MDILLDTQSVIWLVEHDAKIGPHTLKTLEDSTACLFVSHFSLFEIQVKHTVGKLPMQADAIMQLPRFGIMPLAPTIEIYREYRIFNSANRDPFDNILIAQAIAGRMCLVTSDAAILSIRHPRLMTLDARK